MLPPHNYKRKVNGLKLRKTLVPLMTALGVALSAVPAAAQPLRLGPLLLTSAELGPGWSEEASCAAVDSWDAQHTLGAQSAIASCFSSASSGLHFEEMLLAWLKPASATAERQRLASRLLGIAPDGAQVPLAGLPGVFGWEAPCESASLGVAACGAGFIQVGLVTQGPVLVWIDLYPMPKPGTTSLASFMSKAMAKEAAPGPTTTAPHPPAQPLVLSLRPDPAQLRRHGGTVTVSGTLKNAATCQLELLSHQAFPVVYASNARPCGASFSAKVIVGANPTSVERTIAFALVVRNGSKSFTARVYVDIAG